MYLCYMMQVIKILFLSISIFFSFGFTTYQSICGHEEEKVEEHAHSCCKTEVKSKCTQSNTCNAECCLKPAQFYVLNQFVIESNSVDKSTLKQSPQFLNNLVYNQIYSAVKQVQNTPIHTYMVRCHSGKQIISLKQSWII